MTHDEQDILRLIDTLEARAARLAAVIGAVARHAEQRQMRHAALQIEERLQEMVEELRDVHELDVVEAKEKCESFRLRLQLAETKIQTWPLTASARKVLSGQKKIAALAA